MRNRGLWRAGVIGCGAIAQAMHLPGYLKAAGVAPVAACDPVPQRLREAGRIAGDSLKTYRDYREMLAAEPLDIVSVCTPNAFHTEHAIAALEAGANVVLEKPAAVSMKEIAAIKRAVQRTGRLLVVGFSHRFNRGNRRMRQLLQAGVIGEPYMIRLRLAHTGPYAGWAKSEWFYDPRLAGGGALLDMGIHMIDQALWMMGPVRRVQARTATLRKDIPVEDNAVLLLEFERRALGYIEVGWTSPAGFRGIEVLGDSGAILLDYAGQLSLETGRVTPNMKKRPNLRRRVVDPRPASGGWEAEIIDIVRGMKRGSDLGSSIDAGGAALAVALAGYKSSQTGRAVEVKG